MPFGKYRGTKMCDVPADYLLYLYDTNKCNGAVLKYIVDIKDALIREAHEAKYNG